MRYFHPAPFIAVAAVVAFAAGPAAAHARLVSATPAPDSTVAATRTLTLTFSERSVPAFSGFDVVNGCLQLHGGYGYLRDHPIERVLRDVRVHQILEGTNEIMRVIISRAMLRAHGS